MAVHSKRKKEKKHYPFLVLAVLLVLFFSALLLIINLKINQKKQLSATEVKELEKKLQELLEEEEVLKAETFQNNRQYFLEESARENFNLKKEGEEVVAFPIIEED